MTQQAQAQTLQDFLTKEIQCWDTKEIQVPVLIGKNKDGEPIRRKRFVKMSEVTDSLFATNYLIGKLQEFKRTLKTQANGDGEEE